MSDVAVVSGRALAISVIVRALLSKKNAIGPVGVEDDLHDRGLTSLDMVNLMLAVEDEFRLEIPQREITPDNFRTIAAIERLIRRVAD